ncbi:MAG: DNA-binding MarR family transcriptional regulator [Parasphingorhabdus sp.]
MSNDYLDLQTMPRIASSVAIATQRLSQLVRGELEKVFNEFGELSLIEWRICLKLFDAGLTTQKEIVAFTKMQQAQVSRSLRSLEERKFIKTERGVEDRRNRLFSLTRKGRQQIKIYSPIIEQFCSTIDDEFTLTEIKQYLAMSERIAQASLQARGMTSKGNKAVA